MTDQEFTGKWAGEYVYGEEYGEPISGRRIPFEIEMTCTNGHIKGTCVDDESKHFLPEPASIEGFIKDNSISFIKRYSSYWQHNADGKHQVFPKLPSKEIHYAGLYSNGKFEGNWDVKMTFSQDNGDDYESNGAGTWYMSKT